MERYWIDTEVTGGNWELHKVEDGVEEIVSSGSWPDDAINGDYTPAREEEIWDEVNSQIEKDLGFVPYYDIN
jgi:hypothetical protein